MSRRRGPKNLEYIVAGLLGNVPLLFLLFILSFLDPSSFRQLPKIAVDIVFSASLVGGAIVAAFLVSVGVQSSETGQVLEVGLLTGIFCFAMNLFLGFFLPMQIINDYLKLLIFIIGGVVGALLRRMKRRLLRSVRK